MVSINIAKKWLLIPFTLSVITNIASANFSSFAALRFADMPSGKEVVRCTHDQLTFTLINDYPHAVPISSITTSLPAIDDNNSCKTGGAVLDQCTITIPFEPKANDNAFNINVVVAYPGGSTQQSITITPINDPWANKIDAAISWPGHNKLFMFKKNQYIRYDVTFDRTDPGYPNLINRGWHYMPTDFQSNLDAAVLADGAMAYLFKGSQFVTYNPVLDRVVEGPKAIKDGWNGIPAYFQTDIDAAFYWKAYFSIMLFKGNQYIAVNIYNRTILPGFPKPLKGNWHGFPDSWYNGIDAAVYWLREVNKESIMFFKNGEYIKYSVFGNTPFPGYPRSVAGNWPGLPLNHCLPQ